MPANYVLLAEQTVSQTVASVTFSNIPQTGYTDLLVNYSMRSTYTSGTGNTIQVSFNGSTSSFSDKNVYGSGTSAASSSSARNIGSTPSATALANTFGNGCLYIPNYTSSNFKSFTVDAVQENNTSEAYNQLHSGLWSNTSAITSITITSNVNSIAQFSTFYLYGVAALGTTPVIAPKATGGDIVVNDGTYWYHAFLASGTFTPTKELSCDVLQVAGGGGTSQDSGGGGAGGLLTFTSQLLTATSNTVTVGAGGTQASGTNDDATSGNNSQFASLTASVGGGRARFRSQNPTGGSGAGGNSNNSGGITTPGSGTAGQGNAGGTASFCTGGGGGAGGVGGNANGSVIGGTGGIGATSSLINAMGSATSTGQLSGGNYYYAGGGAGWYGGPAAGLGGGGAESSSATANTGGGAGAYRGNGGSGIVIVRYTMA